ncbi:hypothetical protein M885DRAFT_190764 [Pelagophyceae sp. CCMP2097]|nr:hypothetical protein M885DRAFT_190764 [Pelagophyceae sp. CCMP2097]
MGPHGAVWGPTYPIWAYGAQYGAPYGDPVKERHSKRLQRCRQRGPRGARGPASPESLRPRGCVGAQSTSPREEARESSRGRRTQCPFRLTFPRPARRSLIRCWKLRPRVVGGPRHRSVGAPFAPSCSAPAAVHSRGRSSTMLQPSSPGSRRPASTTKLLSAARGCRYARARCRTVAMSSLRRACGGAPSTKQSALACDKKSMPFKRGTLRARVPLERGADQARRILVGFVHVILDLGDIRETLTGVQASDEPLEAHDEALHGTASTVRAPVGAIPNDL